MELAALFASAFLAATILPFSSEIILLALVEQGQNQLLLWVLATSGNTLGAVVNWGLGLGILKFQDRRWFYFSPEQIQSAQRWFNRIGKWALLVAWLPVVGDALTLVAGIARVRFRFFLILVGLGKGLRYVVVLLIWNELPLG